MLDRRRRRQMSPVSVTSSRRRRACFSSKDDIPTRDHEASQRYQTCFRPTQRTQRNNRHHLVSWLLRCLRHVGTAPVSNTTAFIAYLLAYFSCVVICVKATYACVASVALDGIQASKSQKTRDSANVIYTVASTKHSQKCSAHRAPAARVPRLKHACKCFCQRQQ